MTIVKFFINLIHLLKDSKSKKKANMMSKEEAEEKLKEIEVKDDVEKEDSGNKIVDPELIKLKEKLLSKKRKKIDQFYGGNKNEMEKSLEKRVNEDSDEGEEFNIISKINKIESRKQRSQVIKPKITHELNDDKRRILANVNKLTATKFK